MNDYFARFSASPPSFKKSFAALVVAWACHPIFIYSLFMSHGEVVTSENDIKKMVVVSLSLMVFLFSIKKWARALVVVGSLFILINDLIYFFVVPHGKLSTLLCAGVTLFTVMGTYWLFVKDSRDYYTRVNPKIEPPETTNSEPGPNRPR